MITLAPLTGASGIGGRDNNVAREAAGTKKQRDQLRAAMHDQGCTPEQIAAEMARCFGFRARQAWRHTHGWTQDEVAAAYNRLLDHDHAPMTGKRISDFETWPHGGVRPTRTTLAMLATLYSTTPTHLVDLDDRHALSPQELIALDTPALPPATPQPRDFLRVDSALPAITGGERATPPSPDMSIATGQSDHTPPERPEDTAHRLAVGTLPSSPHRRWRLVLACALAIITVIGAVIVTRTAAIPDVHSAIPTHPGPPSVSSSPTASSPRSSALPLPPPPPQTTPPSPIPVSPSMQATSPSPAPHHQPLLPAQSAPQAAPLSARPDPPQIPEPSVTNTASVSTAWKNMHYGLCLDEDEKYVTHDPGGLRLWDCNGTANQMWTEKTITDTRGSIAKNLVSSRSGKCVTYQPDPNDLIHLVSLAPCGQDGQGWIRTWNGKAFIFQASGLHGLCMSVTSGLLAGGFPGIQLRPCDPPSSLTDWLAHPS